MIKQLQERKGRAGRIAKDAEKVGVRKERCMSALGMYVLSEIKLNTNKHTKLNTYTYAHTEKQMHK